MSNENQSSLAKQLREDIYNQIEGERAYQQERWSDDFDRANTINDWIVYILKYVVAASAIKFDKDAARAALLKTATLCIAALEQFDNETGPAPRHYDKKVK